MKHTYAILREDGCLYRTPHGGEAEGHSFYFDAATLFQDPDHAMRVWECLPYHQAIKCRIVSLMVQADATTQKSPAK